METYSRLIYSKSHFAIRIGNVDYVERDETVNLIISECDKLAQKTKKDYPLRTVLEIKILSL